MIPEGLSPSQESVEVPYRNLAGYRDLLTKVFRLDEDIEQRWLEFNKIAQKAGWRTLSEEEIEGKLDYANTLAERLQNEEELEKIASYVDHLLESNHLTRSEALATVLRFGLRSPENKRLLYDEIALQLPRRKDGNVVQSKTARHNVWSTTVFLQVFLDRRHHVRMTHLFIERK